MRQCESNSLDPEVVDLDGVVVPGDGSGAGGGGAAAGLLLPLELPHHVGEFQLEGVALLQQLQRINIVQLSG